MNQDGMWSRKHKGGKAVMPPTLSQTYRHSRLSFSMHHCPSSLSTLPVQITPRGFSIMVSLISNPLALSATNTTQPKTAIPRFVYGTAWKKERTTTLVAQALRAGFRGIDTAAQPRHYREDLVGAGIREVLARGVIQRKDFYVSSLLSATLRHTAAN